MSNDFLDKPRGRWRLILAGAIAAVVLIGLGAVIYRVIDTDDNGTPTVDPTPTALPSEVLGVNPNDLGALTVIPGSTIVDGVSVGYPHTIPGAVSAATEYLSQYGSTLDPERARRVGEIVVDPAWTDGVETLARAPLNARKELGLPAEGPPPAGSSMTLAPVEYQLREPSDDRMIVLLLSYITVQSPQLGTRSAVGVIPATLNWTNGDWKLDDTANGDQYVDLARTPGTPEAAVAGWRGLTR